VSQRRSDTAGEVERNRPGPQPSAAVALGVVHAVGGVVRLDLDEHGERSGGLVEEGDAVADGHDPAAVRAREHGADGLADVDGPVVTRPRIEEMDEVAEDVDPGEDAALGDPHGALADLAVGVEHQLRRRGRRHRRHRAFSCVAHLALGRQLIRQTTAECNQVAARLHPQDY